MAKSRAVTRHPPRPVPPARRTAPPARRSSTPGLPPWDELKPLLIPARSDAPTGWALLPLRAFLGFTFAFAGLQKLANPGFFRASDPSSIQAQLAGSARRSPIHGLVAPLVHVAVPLGIVIALAEIAIAIGTLFGLWARIAAGGGAVLAFFLFLTVSYHASPYYTGSDLVFFFAWLPLLIVGAGGVLSADAVASALVRRRAEVGPEGGRPPSRAELDRRTFAARGALAGAATLVALVGGGVAAAAGRLAGGAKATTSTGRLGLSGASTAPPSTTTTSLPAQSTTTSAPVATTSTAPSVPAGTKIGPASAVPVGGAAQFTDPTTGDPSLVVQPKTGTFLAFDAVCPHAGCIVGYDPGNKVFVCPCHGSEFNGRTGAVETGPAPTGLSHIGISEGSDGQLYVT